MKIDEVGTVSERITKLVDYFCKGNKTAFGRAADIQSGVLAGIVGGRESKPGFEILQKLLTAYPTVEPIWLLFGRGPMLDEGTESSTSTQIKSTAHNEQLLDIVKKEVAEQMAANKLHEDVYRLLNEGLAYKRAEYAKAWHGEAEVIREERNELVHNQGLTASRLTNRLEEIGRAISVLQSIKPGPNGLEPSIAYRVGYRIEPDFSMPFDGMLSRRLNISESEAERLIGAIRPTSKNSNGYIVSEHAVRKFVRQQRPQVPRNRPK